jgi:hypothetical protein
VQQDGRVLSFADNDSVTTTSNVLDLTDRVVFRKCMACWARVPPQLPTDKRAWVGLHARNRARQRAS